MKTEITSRVQKRLTVQERNSSEGGNGFSRVVNARKIRIYGYMDQIEAVASKLSNAGFSTGPIHVVEVPTAGHANAVGITLSREFESVCGYSSKSDADSWVEEVRKIFKGVRATKFNGHYLAI
jgi:hypothetical protein